MISQMRAMVTAIELSGLRQGKRSRSADIPPAVTSGRLTALFDQSMAPSVEGTEGSNPPAAMPRAELAKTDAAEAVVPSLGADGMGLTNPGVDHPVASMVGG